MTPQAQENERPAEQQDEQRIAEIRARVDAATAEPWVIASWVEKGGVGTHSICSQTDPDKGVLIEQPLETAEPDDDLKFAACARQDIPYLLSRLSAAQRERDEARKQRDVSDTIRLDTHREVERVCTLIGYSGPFPPGWLRDAVAAELAEARREVERVKLLEPHRQGGELGAVSGNAGNSDSAPQAGVGEAPADPPPQRVRTDFGKHFDAAKCEREIREYCAANFMTSTRDARWLFSVLDARVSAAENKGAGVRTSASCGVLPGINPEPPAPPAPAEAAAAQNDYPDLDGTDAAHPAWWRGRESGVACLCQRIEEILAGKDVGAGVASQPWEPVRRKLIHLNDFAIALSAGGPLPFPVAPESPPLAAQPTPLVAATKFVTHVLQDIFKQDPSAKEIVNVAEKVLAAIPARPAPARTEESRGICDGCGGPLNGTEKGDYVATLCRSCMIDAAAVPTSSDAAQPGGGLAAEIRKFQGQMTLGDVAKLGFAAGEAVAREMAAYNEGVEDAARLAESRGGGGEKRDFRPKCPDCGKPVGYHDDECGGQCKWPAPTGPAPTPEKP